MEELLSTEHSNPVEIYILKKRPLNCLALKKHGKEPCLFFRPLWKGGAIHIL